MTGQTFVEYVNLCRIRKGEEMIMNSSLPITQIAHRVGFNNINYSTFAAQISKQTLDVAG
ncbi:helix-turn-helix domain-containing protein [Paenibacillus sp. ISL-20]|uniref:helix-turn-helix domain-containing protein n=1 Tax=Paenibacillus sp. ISL-20 TaxID=2819163 RepID=UPI001BE8CF59|nr:hypothetical protein [Paenibacillus sp. ISL-20]